MNELKMYTVSNLGPNASAICRLNRRIGHCRKLNYDCLISITTRQLDRWSIYVRVDPG